MSWSDLCFDRCIEMVIGVLGILKAGGAYLPLDPNYPIGAAAVHAGGRGAARGPDSGASEELLPATAAIVDIDTAASRIAAEPDGNLGRIELPD